MIRGLFIHKMKKMPVNDHGLGRPPSQGNARASEVEFRSPTRALPLVLATTRARTEPNSEPALGCELVLRNIKKRADGLSLARLVLRSLPLIFEKGR